MSDYEFPQAPEIEKAYRAAHRALEGIVSSGYSFDPIEGLPVTEVISQFRSLVREAEMAVAAQLGPLISWEGPRRNSDWELVMSGADLDNRTYDFGPVTLARGAFRVLAATGRVALSAAPHSLTSERADGTSHRMRLVFGW